MNDDLAGTRLNIVQFERDYFSGRTPSQANRSTHTPVVRSIVDVSVGARTNSVCSLKETMATLTYGFPDHRNGADALAAEEVANKWHIYDHRISPRPGPLDIPHIAASNWRRLIGFLSELCTGVDPPRADLSKIGTVARSGAARVFVVSRKRTTNSAAVLRSLLSATIRRCRAHYANSFVIVRLRCIVSLL